MRLGAEGVIPVSDPPHASAGPDAAIDESRLEELIIEAQTALPFELPGLANRCAAALGLDSALIYLVDLQQQLLISLDEALEPLPGGLLLGRLGIPHCFPASGRVEAA